jgi:hypothetical protein
VITPSGMTRLLNLFSTYGVTTLSLDAKEEFISELMKRKIAFSTRCINEEHGLWRIDKA